MASSSSRGKQANRKPATRLDSTRLGTHIMAVDASSSFIIMQNVLPSWLAFSSNSSSSLLASRPLSLCLSFPLYLSPSSSLALLLHLLILIVSLAAAAAGSMQKPELSQHLVFIVVLLHAGGERGNTGHAAMSLACVCGHCGCKLYAQHYFT